MEHLRKIGELEAAAASHRGSFEAEVDGLKRMVDLYKGHFEEATEQLKAAEGAAAAHKGASARQVAQLKEQLQSHARDADEARARERAALEARVEELEAALKEQQLARGLITVPGTSSSSSSSARVVEGTAEAAAAAAAAAAAGATDGLSVIEMYDRVVAAERDLSYERGKRKEAELYLNRILKVGCPAWKCVPRVHFPHFQAHQPPPQGHGDERPRAGQPKARLPPRLGVARTPHTAPGRGDDGERFAARANPASRGQGRH